MRALGRGLMRLPLAACRLPPAALPVCYTIAVISKSAHSVPGIASSHDTKCVRSVTLRRFQSVSNTNNRIQQQKPRQYELLVFRITAGIIVWNLQSQPTYNVIYSNTYSLQISTALKSRILSVADAALISRHRRRFPHRARPTPTMLACASDGLAEKKTYAGRLSLSSCKAPNCKLSRHSSAKSGWGVGCGGGVFSGQAPVDMWYTPPHTPPDTHTNYFETRVGCVVAKMDVRSPAPVHAERQFIPRYYW